MTGPRRPDEPCDSDACWVPADVDIVVPLAARVYDVALGGCANFGPDRDLFAAIVEAYPPARQAYWANRAFVYRAVARFLDAGIHQFVDLGAGIPPDSGTVDEWVHDADPAGRVLYVDIDPVAVEHTAFRLRGTANAWVVRGDLRRPDSFLPQLAVHLDLDEPVAVLATAVIHHLPDDAEATAVLQRIAGELADGSYLALTHATPETTPARRDQQASVLRLYERTPTPITLRTAAQITAVLGAGWAPLAPGVVNPDRWLLDPDDEPLCPPSLLATIARHQRNQSSSPRTGTRAAPSTVVNRPRPDAATRPAGSSSTAATPQAQRQGNLISAPPNASGITTAAASCPSAQPLKTRRAAVPQERRPREGAAMPPLPPPSSGNLPDSVRHAITATIGPIDACTPVAAGSGNAVTALVRTRQGRFFVKAVPAGQDSYKHLREAALAPHLLPVGAALIAHIEHHWDILIFEALDGRPANYAPGSDDLPAVAELLTQVARVPCPSTVELYEAPLRLQQLIKDTDLAYFAGSTLLHTDLAPANVIIVDGRARLVGWSAATRGAAWLDPAFWVIQLIAAGHPPSAAEDIAVRIPAWQHAPATAVSLFATTQARIPRQSPVGETLRAATRRWLEYRRSLPT